MSAAAAGRPVAGRLVSYAIACAAAVVLVAVICLTGSPHP